jgi:hypothetical protein
MMTLSRVTTAIAAFALIGLILWMETNLYTECRNMGFSVVYCIMRR